MLEKYKIRAFEMNVNYVRIEVVSDIQIDWQYALFFTSNIKRARYAKSLLP